MKLISLGNSCKVRESIDRFNNMNNINGETSIFDWVLSNFSAVVHVFNSLAQYQENELFHENKFINNGICPNNDINCALIHKDMQFQSIHDIHSDISYDLQKDDFIEKYRRRSKRLRDTIQNYSEKIHFLYFISFKESIPTINEIYLFLITTQKMRRNLPFMIHLLVPPEFNCYRDVINTCIITDNVNVVYMTSDPSIDPFKEQRRNLNWIDIYKSLN